MHTIYFQVCVFRNLPYSELDPVPTIPMPESMKEIIQRNIGEQVQNVFGNKGRFNKCLRTRKVVHFSEYHMLVSKWYIIKIARAS